RTTTSPAPCSIDGSCRPSAEATSLNLHRDVIASQRMAVTVAAVMGPIVSPVIRLDRVTKSFQGRRALDEVSATIHPGQFVAVIGRSGAGKTTLLRSLARATTTDTRAIHFGDVDLAAVHGPALRAHRARVGMIYQQFNLVRRLRVMDN